MLVLERLQNILTPYIYMNCVKQCRTLCSDSSQEGQEVKGSEGYYIPVVACWISILVNECITPSHHHISGVSTSHSS